MIDLRVEARDRWLIVELPGEHHVVSWAIVGGGMRQARHVVWLEVRDRELPVAIDPTAFLRARLADAGVPDAVGLMTSRSLERYVDVERREGVVAARCLATVGLGNARRIGDPVRNPVGNPVGSSARVGTINVLCCLSVPLEPGALLEALALVAEARTLAVCEAGVNSPVSALPATGSGTDCIVVAAPCRGAGEPYAGKHTLVGHLVGAAVVEAVTRGARAWVAEREAARPASVAW